MVAGLNRSPAPRSWSKASAEMEKVPDVTDTRPAPGLTAPAPSTPAPARRPGVRRWWSLGAVVVLLAGAVGYAVEDRERSARADRPAPTGSTAAVAAAERQRAVDAVLKRRADAVKTGKETLFMADVDPANAKLRTEQRVLFANLVEVGLDELSYQQADERFDQAVVNTHGPTAYLVRVVMTYRIDKIDAEPVRTELGYTFVQRSGRWLLVDDDDIDDELGPGAHREPWDLGRYEVHRGARVMVLVDKGNTRRAKQIGLEAKEALETVSAYWPGSWQGSVLVVALNEVNVRDARFADEDIESAASATSTYESLPGEKTADGEIAGAYIVINPSQRSQIDEILLSHEFTHVATADLGGYEPLWLAEGVAEYVSWKGIEAISGPAEVADWEADVVEDALPGMAALPADSGFYDNQGDVYGVSWLAVRHLVKHLGIQRVLELYADIAADGVDQAARDRIMLAHTGLTEASLFLALKSYKPQR
jgi:hypothetical protein